MKNKIGLRMGVALGTLSVLFALPGQSHTGGTRSGFYAGASVGLSHLSGTRNFLANNVTDSTITNKLNTQLSGSSPGVSVFAGYGHRINCTWLAAELSYLFDSLNSNTLNNFALESDLNYKTRSTGAFGAFFHLGYIPHEVCVLYAILGVEGRRFRMSSNSNNLVNTPINKSYTSIGFVPGIGARINLTKQLSVRAEYKYAIHRSKSATAAAGPNAAGDRISTTMTQKPRVQTFHVGLVWSF